jgi:hypothetical protein
MRLPKVTAEQSLRSSSQRPVGAVKGEKPKGIEMAINVGCIMRCGGNALACLPCGTNVACWATCAGPSTVNCVTRCF